MSQSLEKFHQYTEFLLKQEKNPIQPDREAPVKIALVFPNDYEVGMANLGYQTLYRLLNSYPGVLCERAFMYHAFPDITRTLESKWQLTHFDVIAFSASFEADYSNMVHTLSNIGINPLADKRHPDDPLILAGGTATFINPEPIAPFIDLFVIGEIEPVADILVDHLRDLRTGKNAKTDILQSLSHIDGMYVPQFFSAENKIIRLTNDSRNSVPQFSPIITPKSHFQNMFLIEVGRGCGRFCRFCAASHVYKPVRFFSPQHILTTIHENIHSTKKIGLIGAALCDYPHLIEVGTELIREKYQLGLSSFRFDAISEDFLNIIEKGGVRTITLAPEAGSERLRKIINKPITDERILHSIKLISQFDIPSIKLYFLIGLPFENECDLEAIISLVSKIRSIYFAKTSKRREITVSINAFIPKPFTPFQWAPMDSEKNLRKKRRFIDSELRKIKGIKFNRKNIKDEILQCTLSLGNRDTGLNFMKQADLWIPDASNSDYSEIHKEKSYTDILPWDFIEYPIRREKLWQLWQKSAEFAGV